MSSSSPLIHIGYHKTGTTWLQREVFPNSDLGFAMPLRRQEITNEIVRPGPFEFEPQRAMSRIEPAIRSSQESGLQPVLSCENLSGAFLAGGHDSRQNADRLHEILPDARILIVLREQRQLLRSAYNQYVRAGGVLSLKRWLTPDIKRPRQTISPYFDPHFYEFHHLIQAYQSRFGSAHVLVLTYEQMREDPEAFITRIRSHGDPSVAPEIDLGTVDTGRRINPSLSAFTLGLQRRVNRVMGAQSGLNQQVLYSGNKVHRHVRRSLRLIDKRLPRSVVVRGLEDQMSHIEAATGSRYRASNRCVAKLTQLKLAEMGYDV